MTGTLQAYFLAVGLFLASHAALPRIRSLLIAWLGRVGYLTAYSALSLALLLWVIAAAIDAPKIWLWQLGPWVWWWTHGTMLAASVLLAAGVTTPNPLGVLCPRGRFDPRVPGAILRLTRHPVLWALALWALAHLPANGDLATGSMFALFALYAIVGGRGVDRRRRRQMGEAAWLEMAEAMTHARWQPADILRLMLGLMLYAMLYGLHPLITGFRPPPPPGL